MLKSLAAPLAVALIVSGCQFSKVNPQATVSISGQALDSSGVALAGATVSLFKEADFGDLILGSVLTVGSLGTVCLLPNAPTICNHAHTTTTGPDGRYTLDIKGADTQGLIGTASTLDLVIAARGSTADSPSTTLSFTVSQTTVQLPGARLWNASPTVRRGGRSIALGWHPLPLGYGSSPSYAAQFFTPARQAAIWTQSGTASGATVDARVLEDASSTAAAGAGATLSGVGTGSVHASYLSTRLPVPNASEVPPSRHRPCEAVVGSATLTTVAQPTCAATDGDLVDPARLAGSNGGVVTGAVVDMGRPVPIRLVVARGLAGMTIVELSTDGVHYRQVAIMDNSPEAVQPPGGPVARYVRVRAPSGLDESLLYEISVWTS